MKFEVSCENLGFPPYQPKPFLTGSKGTELNLERNCTEEESEMLGRRSQERQTRSTKGAQAEPTPPPSVAKKRRGRPPKVLPTETGESQVQKPAAKKKAKKSSSAEQVEPDVKSPAITAQEEASTSAEQPVKAADCKGHLHASFNQTHSSTG